MTTDGFKEGDVVQLKSGGSLMTVFKVGDGEIGCKWFDEAGEVQTRMIAPETLQPETDQGPAMFNI